MLPTALLSHCLQLFTIETKRLVVDVFPVLFEVVVCLPFPPPPKIVQFVLRLFQLRSVPVNGSFWRFGFWQGSATDVLYGVVEGVNELDHFLLGAKARYSGVVLSHFSRCQCVEFVPVHIFGAELSG